MSIPRKIGGGHKLQTYDEKDGEYDNRNGAFKDAKGKSVDELKKQQQKELPKKKPIIKSEQKNNALNSDRMQYNKNLTKERVEKIWGYGEQEMQDLSCRLFNEDSFGIGNAPITRKTAFYNGFNKVGYMESDDGGNTPYSDGGVWYHEVWHAIDSNYAVIQKDEFDEAVKKFGVYGWDMEQTKRVAVESLAKNRTLSSSYKLSSGKTLQETLIEEYQANVNAKQVVEKFNAEVEQYYLSKGYNRKEITEKYENAKNEAQKIYDEVYAKTHSYYDAYTARNKFKESEEYKKISKDYWACQSPHPNQVLKKWGDLSDIISGATNDKINMGMHHERKYWEETSRQRGSEFFAECASAKATNPESYALLKEYLPNSVKGFEEIYKKLLKGEIKSNGRRKWQP